MASYILSLLCLVALCIFWAVFQMWLNRHDPVDDRDSVRCGGCDGSCDKNHGVKSTHYPDR